MTCGMACGNANIFHECDWDAYFNDANYHWHICLDCGEAADKSSHYASCLYPDTCRECGAAYSGNIFTHVQGGEYAGDDYYHWYMCELCGGKSEKDAHFVSCLNPGVCDVCGASVKAWSEDEMHSYSGEYGYNEYQHWMFCDDCGDVMEYAGHHADCTMPGVCDACGYEAEGLSLSHYYGDVVATGKASHQVMCANCDEVIWEEEHYVVCGDESMTCVDCGMQGVTGYRMEHLGLDEGSMESRADGHYIPCTYCGENVFESEHEADCDNPDVCYICGEGVGSNVTVRHHPAIKISSDEAYHWQACTVCADRIDPETHWDYHAPFGYCDYCAAAMGDIPPQIGLDSKTVYITSKGYGNVCEIYAYNDDSKNPGALTVSSSDGSVMTAEVVYTDGGGNILRLTGHKAGTATLTVTAPNGLTDTMAFAVVAANNEIILPSDANAVEAEAFAGASGIEFVYVPSGVTTIGEKAFMNCASLKCVYIPASVTEIGTGAFAGCQSVVICTTEGSAAQAYATANGLSWIIE